MSDTPYCPDCGSVMSGEGWSQELCPNCLMRLALVESTGTDSEPDDGETALTEDLDTEVLAKGQILGNRYGIRSLLGRGGMGEVWRAFDLKLRVDMALKSVRIELAEQQRVMELLRREVRSAREVASPNVCRVYDLEELDGRELVSMEYVQGDTLRDILRSRGPLEIQEAREIASQFLAGLEAIHNAGLVHRDLKPANIMITPAGRVVVMDFGIAKDLDDAGTGTISGTPAYMAPEQSRGEAVDARADVFSAGLVLAEMLAFGGDEDYEARQALWLGIRREPPQLPDSPWRNVLEKAVAHRPELRFGGASALARALEEVTLRVEGAEDLQPYPGLGSFSERDQEYFFGRELEIEAMWKKLRRLSMLALIGPSGAGKTSFIRAGLLAAKPPNWSHLICTPGEAPITSLRQALVPELSGDSQAMHELVKIEDPEAMVSAVTRWRSRSRYALLVVDQFEELFTLNPPEVQKQFTELLARLAIDADVRVLLSLRDDFLIRCHAYESLKPILSELTLLGPPAGAALRRAVVQPALKCGYRFEDEALVDEMLSEVEGERGALPLVAFAAEQLWERRDKEKGLLTRGAYEIIGGVGGALAQHAELTLERIGADRVATVRELFRNLVTAEGTRAVRDRDELLSVFKKGSGHGARDGAEHVLDALIDARLLTTYGVEAVEGTQNGVQRIEIVHESLLAAWPRLVRWMTQDVEGAQLRDQLRQAARTWQDRDRPDDLLWTGSAFLEYQLWRERYPGSLSEVEEDFARAMQALTSRRRRRRRVMVTAAGLALAATTAVTTALWRQSVVQTRRAETETARAEASKVVTLGHIALEEERTQGLAYAIAALERADTAEGRNLALSALWAGPPATVLPAGDGQPWGLAFAPDGRHLAVGYGAGMVRVFERNGASPIELDDFEGKGVVALLNFSPDSRYLMAGALGAGNEVCIWNAEDGQLVRSLQAPVPDVELAYGQFEPNGGTVITLAFEYGGPPVPPPEMSGRWVFHRWSLDGGAPDLLGSVEGNYLPVPLPDLERGLVPVGRGTEVLIHRLATLGDEEGRVVARHPETFGWGSMPAFDPSGDIVALGDMGGQLMLWPLAGDGRKPVRRFKAEMEPFFATFSPDGSLFAQAVAQQAASLWDLRGPTGAESLQFGRDGHFVGQVAFSPDGRWLATTGREFGIALWPLTDRHCRVLRGHDGVLRSVTFSPDGSRLYTMGDHKVLAWDLSGGAGLEPTFVLKTESQYISALLMDPKGRFLVIRDAGGVRKVPLDGGTPTLLKGFPRDGLALGPAGRLLAASGGVSSASTASDESSGFTVGVLDLESGERWTVTPPGDGDCLSWDFDPAGRLLVLRGRALSRWDRASDSFEILMDDLDPAWRFAVLSDGRLWTWRYRDGVGGDDFGLLNLEDGSRTAVPRGAQMIKWFSVDAAETLLVTTDLNGEIRVGPMFGEEAHLLPDTKGRIEPARMSRDGRWIVMGNADGSVRLWPVPDMNRPALHTLPYDELLARLKAMTNLRVVPDETSYTGYKVEPDFSAYRGWAEVPEW